MSDIFFSGRHFPKCLNLKSGSLVSGIADYVTVTSKSSIWMPHYVIFDTSAIEAIIQERAPLQQRIKQSTVLQFAGIFGTILGLVLLFIVVIKRHEYALKKTSDMHKEFATSLMNMLDPHAEKIQAKLIHENGDKPMRIPQRK